jgi:hypothetical protein
MDPVPVPTGTITGPKVENWEKSPDSVVSCYLWNILLGFPGLRDKMQTCESPVPVPTSTTTSSQAGKEIKV